MLWQLLEEFTPEDPSYYLFRWEISRTLPFLFGKLGRLWGANPKEKREEAAQQYGIRIVAFEEMV